MKVARQWKVWLVLGLAVTCGWQLTAGNPSFAELRNQHMKSFRAGNYKEAYEGLRKLAIDPQAEAGEVGKDLETGIQCLQRLGRNSEVDDFREQVISVHAKNWKLLATAAKTYLYGENYGFIVAGKFYRGGHRGGGRFVSVGHRDRVRGLQLLEQAVPLTKDENDKIALSAFYQQFSRAIMAQSPWRLQYLTDLSKLPDYEDGDFHGQNHSGAPVDADGKIVVYRTPKSYEASQNDGERWRFLLSQVVEYDPGKVNEVDMTLANFWRSQFGVQTMAHYGRFGVDDEDSKKTGTFALHTLKDNETIARLAVGIRRFEIEDEFNWIKIFERVAGRAKSQYGQNARDALGQEYEDRRQYPTAAKAWKKAIEEYGPGQNNHRQNRFDQIVKNWGRFEPSRHQANGEKGSLDLRFRNADKVTFEAYQLKTAKLLEDVKAYLNSSPNQINWENININDIGHRVVYKNQAQYVGDKVATWDMDLKPRADHVDARVTVETPIKKSGAYLVLGKMADGNTARVILWINDSIIVKKQLDQQVYYYVADAETGRPVGDAKIEFFGWKQEQVAPNQNKFRTVVQKFDKETDKDGQVFLNANQQLPHFQWLVTATKAKSNPDGSDRFAYLGFTNFWFNSIYDPEYNQTKAFTMTDRPVYRPDQTVQFKVWVQHAKYDQPDTSSFANQSFGVRITNPKGEKIFDKVLTADEYGGLAGELYLPREATLGMYHIHIPDRVNFVMGGNHFRVEEYKKPEFEVTVDAPKDPVKLGDKVEATIQAKYYFGAPVAKGTVKYKVTRVSHNSRWYPVGRWDWFYGRGYWWFASDYDWYPGFTEWGCRRPIPWWWGRGHEAPEIVLEAEMPIAPDGKVSVEIDTLLAKELHGNQDHKYTITAEVVDESRRTIVGSGDILVARKPFQVFTWLDRGHYRTGDTIKASFRAQRLDQKPVEGKGELTLFAISYKDDKPVETPLQTWKLDTNVEGVANEQIKAAKPGQYRLSYKVTDAKENTIEGAYVFVVRGDNFDGKDFRFNDIELIPNAKEYQPGEKVKLLINVNQADTAVLLFARPTNGVYLAPKVIHLNGKSTEEVLEVAKRDMPNFFVEALTISQGRIHTEARELVVPPEKRILTVDVTPSQNEYKPGEKATVKIKLTDINGEPFEGSTVVSVYDKSVEYISGGSNIPDIKEFFWKWRRHHNVRVESSLLQRFHNLLKKNEIGMHNVGIFGEMVVEELGQVSKGFGGGFGGRLRQDLQRGGVEYQGLAQARAAGGPPMAPAANANANGFFAMDRAEKAANRDGRAESDKSDQPGAPPANDQPLVEATVRKNFADTALWTFVKTGKDGTAEVKLDMPENLSAWKINVWGLGHGTKVGSGSTVVTTKKDLIVRLQAPRFFVQKDEVVLSANVHNYLKADKKVRVTLELDGGTLLCEGSLVQNVDIKAGGEQRVDWKVKVLNEGEAVVRMKAQTDVDADAMEMRFPCYIHGMLKMESYTGVIRPAKDSGVVYFSVPTERRIEQSRLEVRYSPSLAGALVDALPYLVEYPYGCTEQTLNRFVPTVITQKILKDMKIDLKEVAKHQTNLNSQEIGDDKERIKQWKRWKINPVFEEAEVQKMTDAGVKALQNMQISDGGWGWFSGFGERSYPHTTAVVVHGLQLAKANGVVLPANMLERGVAWLKNYQDQEVRKLQNYPTRTWPWKQYADNMDAFAYMVLVDGAITNDAMREFLFRDRTHISVYAKGMFGLALFKQQHADQLAMIMQNIEQYVVSDDENQTAYLQMPESNASYFWHGNEIEANAYYLKLLAATKANNDRASRMVKYLLNNRKHATYWRSTRDTAICIEAFADYLKATGEDNPDMFVEVWLDGQKKKEVHITRENLFTFDNKLVLTGSAVSAGKHSLEIKRRGSGPVYFNAYVTNFTLEDFITKAGLEVKVNRKYYKLTRVKDATLKVSGARGQALDQKVEKYERHELENMSLLKSGDLVEIELEIDSKNDYEYLIFEDMKAAGFEPVQVRSGYNTTSLMAYQEMRDEKVCFFVRYLARGKHSVSYRMRAEIPGTFSALPTRGYAMYAPELKGNSDEIKISIRD